MKFLINSKLKDFADLFDKEWIINKANSSLKQKVCHITDVVADLSEGGKNDYYSNGDYWWPNPNTEIGLPYIRRDGESNPKAFFAHRIILRQLRSNVANLTVAYMLTKDERYAEKAAAFLQEFFLDERTKMNPHLMFSQAIPGVCSGRGIGIIDTLHLIDVPIAIEILKTSRFISPEILSGLKQWFSDYLCWMVNHEYGMAERNENNNHAICWYVQAAVFARFTDNCAVEKFCRNNYKNILLPSQMNIKGGFSKELARTKPYSYSIFTLDNLVTLCHILSTEEDNLWEFTLEDGRGIRKGMEFLYPYLEDKSKWPYLHDIEHYDAWPVALPSLIFAGIGLGEEKYIHLWKKLEIDPRNDEVRRNISIRQPILWICS